MKTILIVIIVNFLFIGFCLGQTFSNPHYMDPYNPEFEPNEILVKFNDEVNVVPLKSAKGNLEIGLYSFDSFSRTYKVTEMEKVFKMAKKLKSAKLITINGETKEAPQLYNIYKLKVEAGNELKQLVEELKIQDGIDFAEPNYLVFTMEMSVITENPNDPLISEQWHLNAVNVINAWAQVPNGGETQVIAIIDTGTDYNHPDLDDNCWINNAEINGVEGVDDDNNGFVDDIRGWDWINNDNDPMDDNSHGTHVAGIACAEQNNEIGGSGIAFGAKYLALKVLQSNGRGDVSDFVQAIDYAVHAGVSTINMSLGTYAESQTLKTALINAYVSNCNLVAAAGNNGYKIDPPFPPDPVYAPMYPACYNFVLGTEAVKNYSDNIYGWRTSFSNYDPSGALFADNTFEHNYELSAPGNLIMSTIPNGNNKIYSGTSMAAPIVSGALALIQSKFPNENMEERWLRLILSSNNWIDIDAAINFNMPAAQLNYYSHTVSDPEGDNDGKPDAGEIVNINTTVQNAGGFADSVWVKVKLPEFEDTSKVSFLVDSAWIGSIGPRAKLINEIPLKIKIGNNVAQGSIIKLVLEFYNGRVIKSSKEIQLTAERGWELTGILDSTFYLTPDKFWLINFPFRIDGPNAKLVILPGTSVQLNTGIIKENGAKLIAIGKPDSIIEITAFEKYLRADSLVWAKVFERGPRIIGYAANCEIEASTMSCNKLENCIIQASSISTDSLLNSIIYWTPYNGNVFNVNNYLTDCYIEQFHLPSTNPGLMTLYGNYNTYVNVDTRKDGNYNNYVVRGGTKASLIGDSCNFIAGSRMITADIGTHQYIPNQYWGTTDSLTIDNMIYDFYDNQSLPILHVFPVKILPHEEPHGIVHQILINGINPLNEPLDPLGAGVHKFEVQFNRPVDINDNPLVTFGAVSPYILHSVSDSAFWSIDSTKWTAYKTIDFNIADGLNMVRVANVIDNEGMPVPVEDTRFEIIIQASGAASTEFMAIPGIGKVTLDWDGSEMEDILGYNMYRSMQISVNDWSDTIIINHSLIIDSTYIDTEIIPDSTYRYLYKVLGTDMQETDFSKSVTATPFNAANGDANGDQSVDVADIITIVNYISGNNPQPFLFDAADVNYDAVINVLDIVGVVNLISAAKSGELFAATQETAKISIENGTVYVECAQNLAGIQFTLEDISENQQVEILAALQGFEVIRKEYDNRLLILAFNFNGKTFGPGKTAILQLNGENTWIQKAVLANSQGKKVEFEMSGTATVNNAVQLTSEFKLGQNYPNPFEDNTIIPFMLEENTDNVSITIFDMTGRTVQVWNMKNLNLGEHQVEWNSEGNPGVYIYKMQISQNGETSFTQSKRMIVTQ